MARRKTDSHALPVEAVRERAEHRRSGAAGVHAREQGLAEAHDDSSTNLWAPTARGRAALD